MKTAPALTPERHGLNRSGSHVARVLPAAAITAIATISSAATSTTASTTVTATVTAASAAASATTSAVATTTTAAAAAVATTAATTSAVATTTTTTALFPRPRLVHHQRTTIYLRTIQRVHRALGIARLHLNKAETTRASCLAIDHQRHGNHRSVLLEKLPKFFLTSRVR